MLSPCMYWCCPLHVLMLSPTVLKLSLIVLSNLHITEAIPCSTDVISRCTENLQRTEQVPQYWTDVMWGENWICRGEFEFAVANLNLPWWIWIFRGDFEFTVMNFNLPRWILICRDSYGPTYLKASCCLRRIRDFWIFFGGRLDLETFPKLK